MAGSGRFGKYGDLKRKDQIRRTRLLRAGMAKKSPASAKTAWETGRFGKGHKKK